MRLFLYSLDMDTISTQETIIQGYDTDIDYMILTQSLRDIY